MAEKSLTEIHQPRNAAGKANTECATGSSRTRTTNLLMKPVGDWLKTDYRKNYVTQQVLNFSNLLPQETRGRQQFQKGVKTCSAGQ